MRRFRPMKTVPQWGGTLGEVEHIVAAIHTVSEPVNDGERDVLPRSTRRTARRMACGRQLGGTRRPGRYYECDAAVFSPNGKGYLIEVKAWLGNITGNDREWRLPRLVGTQFTTRPNPFRLVQRKSQIFREFLSGENSRIATVPIEALVVLASQQPPTLEGVFRSQVILVDSVVTRLIDAEPEKRPSELPPDVAERAANVVASTSIRVAPKDEVGSWRLLELVDATPQVETWRAVPIAAITGAEPSRLKRHTLNSLLTGERAQTQRELAVRELRALDRLWRAGAQVVRVGAVEETDDGFIVVTEWPRGETLAQSSSDRPCVSGGRQGTLPRAPFGAGINSSKWCHSPQSASRLRVLGRRRITYCLRTSIMRVSRVITGL